MFFFFDELYNITEIHSAFAQICTKKMNADGYFDMSSFIKGKNTKRDYQMQLQAEGSRYAKLYSKKFPNKDNAKAVWMDAVGFDNEDDNSELSYHEAVAIVNWVYNVLKKEEDRERFTQNLMSNIKELSAIAHDVKISKGIVYNAKKVDLFFFSSLGEINEFVSSLQRNRTCIFYRGHSNPNYLLQPSVMRVKNAEENESVMYHELLSECPEDFRDCKTNFQKLVKMQHYGLPTRLLDITRNPLVALFFACEQQQDLHGELIIISVGNDHIKYPQDEIVSKLSRIPENPSAFLNNDYFQIQNGESIRNSYVVYAEKSNPRIVKQDGAFILCGMENNRSLEAFRYQNNGKRTIVIIEKKKEIMQQLNAFCINRAMLFPEIESVSMYISNKYMK